MTAIATLAPGTGSVRFRSTFGQWVWLLVAATGAAALVQGLLAFMYRAYPALTDDWLGAVGQFAVI